MSQLLMRAANVGVTAIRMSVRQIWFVPRILCLLMIVGGFRRIAHDFSYFMALTPLAWIAPYLGKAAPVAELSPAHWLTLAGVNHTTRRTAAG